MSSNWKGSWTNEQILLLHRRLSRVRCAEDTLKIRVREKEPRLRSFRLTRDNVEQYIREYLCHYYGRYITESLRIVPAGSYANSTQIKGPGFDFDLLIVVGKTEIVDKCLDVSEVKVITSCRNTVWWLGILHEAVQQYCITHHVKTPSIVCESPSVSFTTNGVSFDLLPALAAEHSSGTVYLVPAGTSSPEQWRLSPTEQQNELLRDDMEKALPGIRKAIMLVKYFNGNSQKDEWWKIPSFAVTCAAFHYYTYRHLHNLKWPRVKCVTWEKVIIILSVLNDLLAGGRISHIFSRSSESNVLPDDIKTIHDMKRSIEDFADDVRLGRIKAAG
jgi:hypothetical protein